MTSLKHEAQYYGLGPLIKRLTLCEELDECACGDVLFHAYLPPPSLPIDGEYFNYYYYIKELIHFNLDIIWMEVN